MPQLQLLLLLLLLACNYSIEYMNNAILDPRQFKFTGRFDEQAVRILNALRLNQQDMQSLEVLYKDTTDIFRSFCEDAVLTPYGAVMCGLGIVTSDVDCFVKLPGCCPAQIAKHLKKASTLMTKASKTFKHVTAVLATKLPYLSFYHVPTRKVCTITFYSEAEVVNSKLLSYLLSLDQRTLPLTVLIKYWSKVNNLTPEIFNAYTMVLLVIYYLQHKNILPPVSFLQNNNRMKMTAHWNTAFTQIQPMFSNFDSLYQLLGEFFSFYRDFDFDEIVVSPFIGTPVMKEHFKDLKTVPKKLSLYKKNVGEKKCFPLDVESYLCIQDPFDHSMNCAAGVTEDDIDKFLMAIQIAADTFETDGESVFFKRTLLDCTEYARRTGKKPKKPIRIKKKTQAVKQCKIAAKDKKMPRKDIQQLYTEMNYYQHFLRL